MKYRTCPKCDEELELNEDNFYHNKSGPDGFERQCKDCNKKYKDQFILEKPIKRKRIFTPGFDLACDRDRLKRMNEQVGSLFKEAF